MKWEDSAVNFGFVFKKEVDVLTLEYLALGCDLMRASHMACMEVLSSYEEHDKKEDEKRKNKERR